MVIILEHMKPIAISKIVLASVINMAIQTLNQITLTKFNMNMTIKAKRGSLIRVKF